MPAGDELVVIWNEPGTRSCDDCGPGDGRFWSDGSHAAIGMGNVHEHRRRLRWDGHGCDEHSRKPRRLDLHDRLWICDCGHRRLQPASAWGSDDGVDCNDVVCMCGLYSRACCRKLTRRSADNVKEVFGTDLTAF